MGNQKVCSLPNGYEVVAEFSTAGAPNVNGLATKVGVYDKGTLVFPVADFTAKDIQERNSLVGFVAVTAIAFINAGFAGNHKFFINL